MATNNTRRMLASSSFQNVTGASSNSGSMDLNVCLGLGGWCCLVWVAELGYEPEGREFESSQGAPFLCFGPFESKGFLYSGYRVSSSVAQFESE